MKDLATHFGPFRVLVFQNPGSPMLVAQGIDVDLCTQAQTMSQLKRRWWSCVAAHIAWHMSDNTEPFANKHSIPSNFIERYNKALIVQNSQQG